MTSSLLFLALITLVLLLIFPSSTAFIVDIDGEPIYNGREYYIVPVSSEGGLTYTQKNGGCPPYITSSSKTENSPGTPVTISTVSRILIIFPNLHFGLSFKGPTPCGESVMWTQTLDPSSGKAYITTGDHGHMSFIITKGNKSNTYELKYLSPGDGNSYNVGLFEDDGLLGVTMNPNTTVSFKKAFNFLELSTP